MTHEELKSMRREITELIDDVKYESDRLTPLERLPVIQLKSVLNKMNKLTEKTVILMHYIEMLDKKATEDLQKDSTESIEPEVVEEKQMDEIESSDEVESSIEVNTDEAPVHEIKEESVVEDEITDDINEEEEILEASVQENLNTEHVATAAATEKVVESSEATRNVEDKLKNMVVTDLSAAIGINEKYLYASELFRGSTEKLAEVLEELNSKQDFKDAETYMRELHAEYTWNLENDTVKNFIDLVERKFNHS